MLSGSRVRGYDVRHEWGDGEHNSVTPRRVFPDALPGCGGDWPSPIRANPE